MTGHKYLVAETYRNLEQIGEPFEKNGKSYISVKEPCPRCGGLGYLTGYTHVEGGICYKCFGKKFFRKDVRVYTEKEMAAAERAKERRKERTNERIKKAQHDWPRNNGFNDDNLTFIFTIGNTYEIKDELKEAGYKFNRELGWHGAEPFEKDGYIQAQVYFPDVYEFLPFGYIPEFIGEGYIKQLKNEAIIANSSSHYMGEIKERLRNIEVTLEDKRPCNGLYANWMYKFKTTDGNLCCWFTQKDMDYEVGAKLILSGTVSKHDNYNGECETFLSRCIVKEK